MNRILLTISFFICTVLISKAQILSDNQKAVQSTVINMFEALSNRDSVAFKAHCTIDVVFFEYGKTWNIDTLITKTIKNNLSKDFKRINTIDFINTTVNHDVAWATYNNQADITKDGNHLRINWIETVVLVKERKIWKIKVLHSTFLKKS